MAGRQRLSAWLLVLGTVVMTLAGAGSAAASYPGRAGAITFQENSDSIDYLNNGASSDQYSFDFVRPPGRDVARRVFCRDGSGDFSGSGEQYCPLVPYTGSSYPSDGPSWSPDGKRLVFAGALYHNDGSRTPTLRDCPGECEAIVLANADGRSPRLLPVAIGDAEEPAFMPDGKTLIFAGKTTAGAPYDLYTAATDGTALQRLTGNGASHPAPCASGSIVYVHQRDLYLRDAGGRTRRLTRHGGSLPDCSRDSRTIAFVRDGALYTIHASGRGLRRLSPRRVVASRPAFSPAGGLIAVTTITDSPGCASASTSAHTDYRLELIDLRGRRHRSYAIHREDCVRPNPEALSDVAWQPLPTPSKLTGRGGNVLPRREAPPVPHT